VQHKGVPVGNNDLLGKIGLVQLGVDRHVVGVAEHAEIIAKAHVDRSGLDQLGAERVEDDAPLLDLDLDVVVRENHCGPPSTPRAARGKTL